MEDQILLVGESRPGSRDSVSYIINSSVTTRPLLISGEFSWQGWHDMPDTVKGNSLLCNSLQWITLPLPPVFALPLCILVNQCIFSFCHFCWDWLTCWKSSAISLLKKKKKKWDFWATAGDMQNKAWKGFQLCGDSLSQISVDMITEARKLFSIC